MRAYSAAVFVFLAFSSVGLSVGTGRDLRTRKCRVRRPILTTSNSSESNSSSVLSGRPQRRVKITTDTDSHRKIRKPISPVSSSSSSESIPASSQKRHAGRRGVGIFENDIYDQLVHCLSHKKRPVLSRSSPTYNRDKIVYNNLQRRNLSLRRMYSPVDGKKILCLLSVNARGEEQIALRQSCVKRVIRHFYKLSKGEGSRKLFRRISSHYGGISEPQIQQWLNNQPEHRLVAPTFKSKAPLKTVRSSTVHNHNQIDLVDFSSRPTRGSNGILYKYVLGILDVCSRFLVLRALENKEAKTVARELRAVYGILGYPQIVQCDRGKEFMGEVTELLQKRRVQIRRSSPYHPQSQGKIERSNRTWKTKLQVDIRSDSETISWADQLEEYQYLYNSGVHRSLGKYCPYEVFYGRKPVMPFAPTSSNSNDSHSEGGSDSDSEGNSQSGDVFPAESCLGSETNTSSGDSNTSHTFSY